MSTVTKLPYYCLFSMDETPRKDTNYNYCPALPYFTHNSWYLCVAMDRFNRPQPVTYSCTGLCACSFFKVHGYIMFMNYGFRIMMIIHFGSWNIRHRYIVMPSYLWYVGCCTTNYLLLCACVKELSLVNLKERISILFAALLPSCSIILLTL